MCRKRSATCFLVMVGESSSRPLRSHVSGLNRVLGFLVLCGLATGDCVAGTAVTAGAGVVMGGEGLGLLVTLCTGLAGWGVSRTGLGTGKGIAGAGLAGQGNVSGIVSRAASVSGSCEGNVWMTGSEVAGGVDGEGFGINFRSLRYFLFLKVSLPVPSTFTEYWS